MVSSFANYVFRAPPTIGRRRSLRHAGGIRRILRSHWLLEPLVLCAVLGVLVLGANAADLDTYETPLYAPAPQSLWAGPYLGFEGGVSQTVTELKSGGRTKDFSRVDAAFGLFGGYNWEVSRFVLGVEGGAAYLGAREKGTHPTLGAIETGSKWTINAKARVGMAIKNVMPYLSLGIAATEHSLKANGTERNSVSVGPVLGGGVEVAVMDAWHLRADYSLTGILDETARFGGTKVDQTAGNHRLMIGLSRSF
ncbi:outer membrane protein [Roseibium aggregatum]|uniref:outer membrane protein n=1 Tax=Roseibium aggregatum TaxID=187304 RepID=UPI003A9859D1